MATAPSNKGYFLHPTIHQQHLVFIAEDDLWEVPVTGGRAVRLTNSRGPIHSIHYSPDGKWLACGASEEGDGDVYLMDAEGGPLRRITYLQTALRVIGWYDLKTIIFRSAHQSIHGNSDASLFTVSIDGGPIQSLPFGPVCSVSYSKNLKKSVLGRNNTSNSRWKRYRGGTAGEVWVDATGNGEFQQILMGLSGNPVQPLWIGRRIYFISDHQGIGNIYSCASDGTALRQETFHTEFYVRQMSTDGTSLVYHHGGDLWSYHLEEKKSQLIDIQWHSLKVQLERRFFYGSEYLENVTLHPEGHSVALTTRGKLVAMPLWEQAPLQYGIREGVRYRLAKWLADGKLVALTDQASNREQIAVFPVVPQKEPLLLLDLPEGRIQSIVAAPEKNQVVFTTSRMELYWADLDEKTVQKLDHSPIREIGDVAFSADGRWIAYTKYLSMELTAIFLLQLETQTITQITDPVRYDFQPVFDPKGHYLYFLSSRTYNPIADSVQIGFSFNQSVRPYAITLQESVGSPFIPKPQAPGHSDEDDEGSRLEKNKTPKDKKVVPPLQIDLAGIMDRVIEFPVKSGLYSQIIGLPQKVLFIENPLQGELYDPYLGEDQEEAAGILWCYDFEKQSLDEVTDDVYWMQLSADYQTLLYLSDEQVRVVEVGAPLAEEPKPSRKTGWLDLDRIVISIDYIHEWRQMYREAWRLQKEFFWTEDMSGVDWDRVHERYLPLLERLGSRSEFSDLMWEVQGELGTSHAYEYGGDYAPTPQYPLGRLGADLGYDAKRKKYYFKKIYRGDIWKQNEHSPLAEPGIPVKEGDFLLEIGGIAVGPNHPPEQLLVHHAGNDVLLKVQPAKSKQKSHTFVIKALASEQPARYRQWVTEQRQWVSQQTEGKVGYIHIPDMGLWGIAEFHRAYLAQTNKQGLIIDVRYNAGGMVSPLILEKLAHRHLGYDVPRWGAPESYPYHTVHGHLLALTNEFAGSDGDMFCHSFKSLGLGPLIGKRTWGGVIGIDSRYQLVDGTTTTQPQYSIWFHNSGWSVENHGVEPDIKVEYPPQAYAQGIDPQLEFAVQHMLELLQQSPVKSPDFTNRPQKPLPIF